jgi:6-hydroxytryprostatin B O-methyltransferase
MASVDSLASTITEQVSQLLSLLQQEGLPPPSLDEASFGDFAHETDTPTGNSLRESRHKILDAAQDLLRLVRGPTEQILTLAWSVSYLISILLVLCVALSGSFLGTPDRPQTQQTWT